MRTWARTALGATYAVTIPGRRSREGLTISQTVTNQARLALTLEEGFARYGNADPDIIIGGSVSCPVPSRRLRYELRLPPNARVRDPFIACKPRHVLPARMDRRWIEHLHGHAYRFEFDLPSGLFRLEVDHPLCGFDYGIGVFLA